MSRNSMLLGRDPFSVTQRYALGERVCHAILCSWGETLSLSRNAIFLERDPFCVTQCYPLRERHSLCHTMLYFWRDPLCHSVLYSWTGPPLSVTQCYALGERVRHTTLCSWSDPFFVMQRYPLGERHSVMQCYTFGERPSVTQCYALGERDPLSLSHNAMLLERDPHSLGV